MSGTDERVTLELDDGGVVVTFVHVLRNREPHSALAASAQASDSEQSERRLRVSGISSRCAHAGAPSAARALRRASARARGRDLTCVAPTLAPFARRGMMLVMNYLRGSSADAIVRKSVRTMDSGDVHELQQFALSNGLRGLAQLIEAAQLHAPSLRPQGYRTHGRRAWPAHHARGQEAVHVGS